MSALPILALIGGVLAAAFLVPVVVWWAKDRSEQRTADWEFRRTALAPRRFQVALPYLEAGSYHRAAPRPVIRSGPLYPADLPGQSAVSATAKASAVAQGANGAYALAGESIVAVPAVQTRRVLTATVPPLPRQAAGTRPEAASTPVTPPPAPAIVPAPAAPLQTHSRAGAGAASLPAAGTAVTGRAEGTRPLAAEDTSIDMDSWLIELLTCPQNRIKTAARQSLARYRRQTEREVAAYLRGLTELAS